MAKVYLGRMVYAEVDEWGEIWLTTGNGIHTTNEIHLDTEVYSNLIKFYQSQGESLNFK